MNLCYLWYLVILCYKWYLHYICYLRYLRYLRNLRNLCFFIIYVIYHLSVSLCCSERFWFQYYNQGVESTLWVPFNTSSPRWIQHFLCLAVITLRTAVEGGRCWIRLKITDSQLLPRQTWAEFATSLFRPLILIPPRFSAGRPATTTSTAANIFMSSKICFHFTNYILMQNTRSV